jgi:hypothetical protein
VGAGSAARGARPTRATVARVSRNAFMQSSLV